MELNPYAPPNAVVSDEPFAAGMGLKRRRVITMIVLVIATFGVYYPIWFFRRRSALNRLSSPRKLRLWPLVACCALMIVDWVLVFASAPGSPVQIVGAGASLVFGLVRLAVWILILVQCFIIKDILEDHLAGPDDASHWMFEGRVKLSGLMTFFFSIFYLQHVINRYVVGSPVKAV
jgi:hypothetical protein